MAVIYQEIQNLLQYGLNQNLYEEVDYIYIRNRILFILGIHEWKDKQPEEHKVDLSIILGNILDWAYENGKISTNTTIERDLLDTEIMNALMPRPSEIINKFQQHYLQNPETATNYFYQLSNASNYIRNDRIKKNIEWNVETPYGPIVITINLSKPEMDPKEIEMLKNAPISNYPTCLLCRENEGYQGTFTHPSRATHRIIPIALNHEEWYLQYSPYVYYNEHCIVFRKEHVPMQISRQTINRLLDFIEQFPHYFIGSNADLPIVGGSILSHDHYQGGNYTFALERAEVLETVTIPLYPSVEIGLVQWPMSVIRITGQKEEVAEVAEFIWRTWQKYSDPSLDILAYSNETPHNTVTPIARKRGSLYEMDIVLRNNRTSQQFPDGIFHPHQELHHIKKENIGLIEVMGLAVLPGRLEKELKKIAQYLIQPIEKVNWETDILKHWDWYEQLLKKYVTFTEENVIGILKYEVGRKFQTVLEHSGVFKDSPEGRQGFHRFLKQLKEIRGRRLFI